MSACPDKMLLLHALVDNELDAANASALETHLRSCSSCARELARIERLRARIRSADISFRSSSALMERIDLDIQEASASRRQPAAAPNRGYTRRWFAAGVITGLAAGIAAMLAVPLVTAPGVPAPFAQDPLVANHVRSLMAAHLTDVKTSDRHQVKPWFNGKVEFAPPVPDLSAEGFPLTGGRLDYLDGRTIAAIVYHRRLHPINLFVRPAGRGAPASAVTRHQDGYNLVSWTAGDLEFQAVSDLNAKELVQFQTLFEARTK